MARTWVHEDVFLEIYLQDEDGNILDPSTKLTNSDAEPAIDYCYMESSSLDVSIGMTRKQRTAYPSERLIPQGTTYRLSSGYIHFSEPKNIGLDKVFNREQPLLILYRFVDRVGFVNTEEARRLELCYNISFELSSRRNGSVTGSAVFIGTENIS